MESMIVVRAMKKADVKAVYEIEVLSFRTPWSYRSLMGELKNSVAHYTVMEKDGEVIGYCGMWVLFEEAHITNIAIHPKLRGHGYGKQLALKRRGHRFDDKQAGAGRQLADFESAWQ